MRIQQTFIALLCALLASQQIDAVVNNGQTSAASESETKSSSTSSDANVESSSTTQVTDSVAASSEKEANRREAPLQGLYNIQLPHETYGPPQDSYLPPAPSNPGLPAPVYGVPDSPVKNIVYPGPPPDILPALPNNFLGPKALYGPPQKYGAPFPKPPKPFNPLYNKPKPFYGPPLRHPFGPLKHHFKPKPFYGPPKSIYGPPPKPFHGPPPKINYGPPLKIQQHQIIQNQHQHHFHQQHQFQQQQLQHQFQQNQQQTFFNLPNFQNIPNPPQKIQLPQPINKEVYGPPKTNYGPPEPIPHGPPHPGIPAPPTPPEIKYDGWQPIPGLISKPPTKQYGPPTSSYEVLNQGNSELHLHNDVIPPPLTTSHGVSSLSLGSSYGSSAGISDSYGAPLNTVTGSGGIVSSSGDAHIQNQDQNTISLGLSAAGLGGSHENHLSLIKSIGYEIFPHGGHIKGGSQIHSGDSYSAPPLNSFSGNGPYAASHSYHNHGLSSASSSSSSSSFGSNFQTGFDKGLSLSSSGIGLIPPSGVYGVPPAGSYGTPLINHKLNALDLNPPKRPVVFREPVPNGLLQSIGHSVAQKDVAGIIESSHSSDFSGPTYIPPPIPELAKDEPRAPSTFFSLPQVNNPTSFQTVNKHHGGYHGAHSTASHSFAASLGSVDTSSFEVPQPQLHNIHGHGHGHALGHGNGLTVSLDHSLPPVTIDLTHGNGNSFGSDVKYDCTSHNSQPLPPLPSLTYGVPSASSYTASLSSLTTNIGNSQYPSFSYGSQDSQTAHSQQKSVHNEISINSVEESSKEHYGKSLAESFAPGGEVIKSESIDLNNIPVQGALGSYTLQIQAADGAAGTNPSSINVPHHQLLSDGLLQSIIDAIEPSQHKPATIYGQPLIVQPDISSSLQLPSSDVHLQFRTSTDDDAQQSIKSQVVVTAPVTDETLTTEPQNTDSPLQLIDDNEIALYFNANAKEAKDQEKKIETSESLEVRNGQQYGSYEPQKTSYA
ncbi:PREDICTED: uncharacterized protein LOC108556737 [Nicrophorus vespilloides]|uniref:Uncharacterized protein LOC108556737 n=1 Tax=Nicrophorus vespilloides TaxID=110193 RepID=A0ABM1M1I9_NICVS|nr:PREDICTED: uncharacterized protein LOC108556737 [Nicrophorus vespilloides]